MTFCTPGVILESTIRDWNHARRSGTISRPMSSGMCAASERSGISPVFVDSCASAQGAWDSFLISPLWAMTRAFHIPRPATGFQFWKPSYVVFQLPPFFANIRKRLIKSPKLYFYDVGLASYLIGIEHAWQIATHPLRGALFENAVVAEALKYLFNRGRRIQPVFFPGHPRPGVRPPLRNGQSYWRNRDQIRRHGSFRLLHRHWIGWESCFRRSPAEAWFTEARFASPDATWMW